jgi:hypothetical protein
MTFQLPLKIAKTFKVEKSQKNSPKLMGSSKAFQHPSTSKIIIQGNL